MYNLDHRPRRPRPQKPSSKTANRQRQIDDRLQRFNIIYAGAMLALALLFVVRLGSGELGNPLPIATVGDQLTFKAGTSHSAPHFTVAAQLLKSPWSPPGVACTLDSSRLFKTGSTVTVMAVRPDGVMLSLASPPMPAGALCPAASQLLVSNSTFANLQASVVAPIVIGPK